MIVRNCPSNRFAGFRPADVSCGSFSSPVPLHSDSTGPKPDIADLPRTVALVRRLEKRRPPCPHALTHPARPPRPHVLVDPQSPGEQSRHTH